MSDLLNLLQSHNHLINLIRCNPQISKTELSSRLKLSWPTISTNISLLKDNSILDLSDGIQINHNAMHMIGLSISAAQIKFCIIGLDFSPIDSSHFCNIINSLDLFKYGREYMKSQNKTLTNYIYFKTPDNLFELLSLLDSIMEDICAIIDNQHDFNLNVISFGITFTGAIDEERKEISDGGRR